MSEEQFNTEILSIKSDVVDLFATTNELFYEILLKKLSSITFQNAGSKVEQLFQFVRDSIPNFEDERFLYKRLYNLFEPFLQQQRLGNRM